MKSFGVFLLTFVGFISSAQSLQCKACESTIGWDDCQSRIFLENCGVVHSNKSHHVHQCFQLEEKDPASNTVLYRQGCTGDASFCTERPQESMQQCSLCTDDNESSECTSMVHRVKKTQDGKLVDVVDTIHFQRTEGDAKVLTPEIPRSGNSSIVIDVASRKNDSVEANTLTVEMKNKQTPEKNETQILLTKQVEESSTTMKPPTTTPSKAPTLTTPKSPCNRNAKKSAVSADEEQGLRTVVSEKAETSTSTSSTIGPNGPMIATGPPPPNSSGSFGLAIGAQTWVVGLFVVVSFLVFVV